ncbi:MAG: asparagine synthase (glutamine-hydrolyzing) [Planctomycetota bacterium]
MNAAQAHRGPDGCGVFEDASAEVSLGHVRLAILDLSDQATQPMHSADGRYVLVFNGEIYNFLELRESLATKGHTFSSTGDTEVLLCGLQQYGEAFVDRLNGMFAFALWDKRNRQLLLVRDQLGIKPVYYAEPQPGTLLFASEIKALCAHPTLKREPDFRVLQQHLSFCHASGEGTAIKGVRRLLPGTILRWTSATRTYTTRRYWTPSFDNSVSQDREQAVGELRALIKTATIRQLVSDVPVGSSLSGGLDSSLLTAFAVPEVNSDFQGYTIAFPPGDLGLDRSDDDAPQALTVAKTLGLPLQQIEIQPQVASLWPDLIYHLDEPLADPAAISCYLVSKLARENGATVLISGQGADELFCGYPRYRAIRAAAYLDWIPRFARRMISSSARLLPGSWEGKFGIGLRQVRRVASALHQTPDDRFLAYCAATPENEIDKILSPALKAALRGSGFADDCVRHMNQRSLSGLERFQDRDLCVYLSNHNLLYTDKMGMAVSLEGRVPFLDLDLVEQATRYPSHWKLSNRTTKALLRDAARGVIPNAIINRPKAGFGAPFRKWLRHDLASLWHDLTAESGVKDRGWFDHRALQEARRSSQAGQVDLYMLQWAVLTIELWARQFIDRNPALDTSVHDRVGWSKDAAVALEKAA